MAGSIRFRVPGRLNLPTQFFGVLTTRQLVQTAAPVILVFIAVYPPRTVVAFALLCLAGVLGLIVAVVRPFGQPLEVLAASVLRWAIGSWRVRDGTVRIRNHDYLELGDGTVAAVIEVTPVNLGMKTRAEQAALHDVYTNVLETATYPVQIHSRQHRINLDTHLDTLARPSRSHRRARADTNRLRTAYYTYLSHLNRGELVATRHYVTVRVEPRPVADTVTTLRGLPDRVRDMLSDDEQQEFEEQEQEQGSVTELDRRVAEITHALNGGQLTADRVTGPDLTAFTRTVFGGTPNVTPRWTQTPTDDGGEWRRTLYITEFPSQTRLAWPADLLEVDGLVDVTQVIDPVPPHKVVTKLRRIVEKLEAEIGSRQAAGYRGTNRYEARHADANWMLDLLADREAGTVRYGASVTVHHPDRDRCLGALSDVETRLQTMQFDYQHPVFRTDAAYRTQSPLHRDGLGETQLMPAQSAAAGFPFATTDAIAETGIVYGEDAATGTPVLLDRFTWSSHSMARMGMVGSGKSYAAKLELVRSWLVYDDLQVIVVDPKQEYQDLVRTFGGRVYTLGRERYRLGHDAVCLTVPDRGQDENVAHLVRAVEAIYQYTARSTRPTLVLIDEARILLNDETGRQVLNQFVLEARDTNTGITLVTQNASHFTYCREGREILDNMPAKIFMRHDRVPTSVVDYFQLSERERQELFELRTGTDSLTSEGILKLRERGVDAKLTVRATTAEHQLLTRGTEEGSA